MIKYVFFDFNGTILDDVDLCLNLLNKILIKQGSKPLSLEEYKHVFTFPVKKYYELAGVDFSKDSFANLSKWFIAEYQPASYKCHCYPHLKEVVEELKNRGLTVGVLSASELSNLKKQLEVLGLISEFSFILGLDNIYASSKITVAKNFIENNNINPKECLMIGDTTHDYEVSQSLGMQCILFSGGHQAVDVLVSTGAKIIASLDELIKYIEVANA